MQNYLLQLTILFEDNFNLNFNYSINSSKILNFNSTGIKLIEIFSKYFYFNPLIYISDMNALNNNTQSNIQIFGIY